MAKIDIKNLSKSFENNIVLDNVPLCINDGDIYGILGLSGAGKSTLVRCINGLEKYENGQILYDNEVINDKNIRNIRRKVAMIFQSFNLLEQRTVLNNVLISCELFNNKLSKKENIEKALNLLKIVGLEEKINCYPSQLSGGQKQRVAIARALMSDPDVLLCDEATSALDPETTEAILDLLKKLNKEFNLTIIMISHQINVIERICNKVAIISNAKIVENGNTSEVFTNPQTDIAKRLVYSANVVTSLDDNRLIKIVFDGDIDEPLVANIIKNCNVLISVVYANSWTVAGRVYGQLIFKLPSFEENILKIKKYLDMKKVNYTEVSKDELTELK